MKTRESGMPEETAWAGFLTRWQLSKNSAFLRRA